MLKAIMGKYESFALPVKASIWFTICSILQKGIALITIPIFTRIMTVEQYGIFTLYQSWFNIIIIITTLNLHLAVFSTAMIKFEHDRERYLSSMQGLTTTITFAVGIIYLISNKFLSLIIGLSDVIMFVMFLDLLVYPAFNFWASKQRFEYKYKLLIVVTLIVLLFSSIAGIVAVLLTQYQAEAKIFSLAITEIVVYSIIYIYNFKKGKAFFDKYYWRYAIGFCIPLLPHYLAGTILNQSDRIMINYFDGSDKAAIYGVSYSAAMLVLLFVNAINASFTPWLYEKLKKKDYSQINNISFQLMVLVCAINCILVLFAPEIMYVLGGREYVEARWVFPVLSASTCFIFLYSFFASVEFYFEKKYFIMIASVMSAGLNIILNYFLIPKFGYYVAGYTTLICYVIYALLHVYFMIQVTKRENIPYSIYPIKRLFILAFAVAVWCLLCSMLFKQIIIRDIVIVIIVLGVIVFRKRIVDKIRKLLMSMK